MEGTVNMKILATSWGLDVSADEFCSMVKKEGYDGIEAWWPMEKKGQDELFAALSKFNLDIGFLCGGYERDPSTHLDTFKKMTEAAATNKIRRPLYINCHSGRDYYPREVNDSFIHHTTDLSKDSGVLICHETHRSRILFAAHIAKQYLQDHPQLKITLDISHWCNVHESYLDDQSDAVQLALERTEHIHARIGHPEGPQVNDPRAPEWENAVKAHLQWWDQVVARKEKEGGTLTFLTEFGPPDYMPTVPYTRKPVADQWAINVHMMKLLQKRYRK